MQSHIESRISTFAEASLVRRLTDKYSRAASQLENNFHIADTLGYDGTQQSLLCASLAIELVRKKTVSQNFIRYPTNRQGTMPIFPPYFGQGERVVKIQRMTRENLERDYTVQKADLRRQFEETHEGMPPDLVDEVFRRQFRIGEIEQLANTIASADCDDQLDKEARKKTIQRRIDAVGEKRLAAKRGEEGQEQTQYIDWTVIASAASDMIQEAADDDGENPLWELNESKGRSKQHPGFDFELVMAKRLDNSGKEARQLIFFPQDDYQGSTDEPMPTQAFGIDGIDNNGVVVSMGCTVYGIIGQEGVVDVRYAYNDGVNEPIQNHSSLEPHPWNPAEQARIAEVLGLPLGQ